MPRRSERMVAALGGVVALAALAGCRGPENNCNCCCSAAVAPTRDAVWVAQGTRLLRLDPVTGRVEWTRRVTRPTPSGSEELMAVSAGPRGVWVAWHSGAALIPGQNGPAVRIKVTPRTVSATLATVDGHTWLGAGRRAVALHADGTTGPTIRFPAGVRLEGAPHALVARTRSTTTLLDPTTGARLSGALVSVRSPWQADYHAQEVTHIDSATGAIVGVPVKVEGLGGVVEAPDGSAYATTTNHHLGVARLAPDGPRILWRTPIAPG